MASAQFSLKERDKKRWLKDRLVRFSVTCGGVSVLACLVLIFVYLAMVILPYFLILDFRPIKSLKPLMLSSQLLYLLMNMVNMHLLSKSPFSAILDLDAQNTQSYFERDVFDDPIAFSRNTPSENWFAFADSASNMTFFIQSIVRLCFKRTALYNLRSHRSNYLNRF